MNKNLVVYFSASGTTKIVAERLSRVLNCDLKEVVPKDNYTNDDLNWMDKNSRSSLEMNDKNKRPEIIKNISNIDDYDTIYLGFPIWWYTYPKIINTFIESYDFKGKRIVTFATSGGSGIEKSTRDLKETYKDLEFINGKRFSASVNENELLNWVKEVM